MSGLKVVAREISDTSNLFCIYCGRRLVSLEMKTFPEPCEHVLFRADSEVGFTHIGLWARQHLTGMGFRVEGGASDWLVEHPGAHEDPPSEEAERFEDDPYLTLAEYFQVADGFILVDVLPDLLGGPSLYFAMAGPEEISSP